MFGRHRFSSKVLARSLARRTELRNAASGIRNPKETVPNWTSEIVAPASAGDRKVVIEARAFSPQMLKVHVGDRVTWTNRDDAEHFLTSSGPLTRGAATRVEDLEFHKQMIPGSEYSHSFRAPGNYAYFCAIHMGMSGTIVVEP